MRDDGMIKVSRSVKELGFKARNAAEELTKILDGSLPLKRLQRNRASREEIAASLEAAAEVESSISHWETAVTRNCF